MLSAMFIWLASAMMASAGEATLTLDVWPDKAPGETGSIGPEKAVDQKPGDKPVELLTNITHPTLSIFRPARDKDTGVAVVICPGGGYNILAFDLEGEEVATWLNSIGVTGIVLKYRVPRREGTPRDRPPVQALMDAQRSLSLVRSKAGEWGIDSKRIGILGFSAGGHLSAWAATHFDERPYTPIDDADKLSCRPDFAVLVYPGGMDRKGNTSSPIAHVSSTTPAMFLAQAGDDPVDCKNSVEMFLALKNAKVPVELHIYSWKESSSPRVVGLPAGGSLSSTAGRCGPTRGRNSPRTASASLDPTSSRAATIRSGWTSPTRVKSGSSERPGPSSSPWTARRSQRARSMRLFPSVTLSMRHWMWARIAGRPFSKNIQDECPLDSTARSTR